MFSLKYIIIQNGFERPYLFSSLDQHREIASLLRGDVVSAGFVRHTAEGLECYGESESLGIKSRPAEDTKLINLFLLGSKQIVK